MTNNPFALGQTLLIDKPLHWTSFDVVRSIRNLVKTKKVGHAGTLDPLATGLLIVCTGKFTKRIHEFMAAEKEYTGTFTLGATTVTFDAEATPENIKDISGITTGKIYEATQPFTGEIFQKPPAHSAIKQKGQRVYELARQGKEVIMQPRKITVKEFEIMSVELPLIRFRVVCTTGTYIRSLANDFGQALGCGAYLSELCRTRIGVFSLEQAMDMDTAEKWIMRKMEDQNG